MASSNFPYTFTTVPDTLKSPFKEHFPAYTEGLVQSNPGNFVYHPLYGANAKKCYDFPIRKDDVWIRTFPRSGKEFDNSICKMAGHLNNLATQEPPGLPNWLGSL
jgi:hypothetical protein